MIGARLWRDRRGLAFIEFALMLPIMILVIMGGLEVMNFAMTHQKINRMAMTAADLTARNRKRIDEADMAVIMQGALMASGLNDFDAQGKLIVSSITRNTADTGQWIRWQRCQGSRLTTRSHYGEEGAGETDASLGPLNGISLPDSVNIIYAEATYRYRPRYAPWLLSPRDIYYQATYVAREMPLNSLTNTTNLPEADLKICRWPPPPPPPPDPLLTPSPTPVTPAPSSTLSPKA